MSIPVLYGIKNCDTVKKALKWCEAQGVHYNFHDYKKQGVDEDVLKQAMREHGWEDVINRRGTTWRALSDAVKEGMDEQGAIKAALGNASLIKRPLLLKAGKIWLGFKEELYTEIFK